MEKSKSSIYRTTLCAGHVWFFLQHSLLGTETSRYQGSTVFRIIDIFVVRIFILFSDLDTTSFIGKAAAVNRTVPFHILLGTPLPEVRMGRT
jgi:hypothetical protein